MTTVPSIGLVTAAHAVDAPDPLQAALEAAGARVGRLGWDPGADPAADLEASDAASYDVLVLRPPLGEAGHLADLLAWSAAAERVARLVNPVDVLRWAAHRGHLVELGTHGVPVLPTRVLPAASPDVLDQLDECPWDEVVVSSAVVTEDGDRDPRPASVPPAALAGRRDDPAVLEHTALLAAAGDVVVQPRGTSPRSLVLVGGAVVAERGGEDHDPRRAADVVAALAALEVAPGCVDLARVRLVDHEGVGVVAAIEAVAPDLGDDVAVLAALAEHLLATAAG